MPQAAQINNLYGFNKARGRLTLSPKEKYLLGPQFTLHASATAVQERPAAKKDAQYKTVDQLLSLGGSYSNSTNAGYRRPTTFPESTTPPADSVGSASVAYLYRQTSTGSAGRRQYSSTSSALATESPKSFGPASNFEAAEVQSGQSPISGFSQRLSTYIPGEKVLFRESPSVVGVPVVFRSPEEKSVNSERLNLDRRGLVVCPILDGEEQLRLLNYQHNSIRAMEHLDSLRRLIFLDFYDNQIEFIDGLSGLRSLRVLMLGKNRIKKIENLENLTKLDVLDLHGNQIKHVEGLNHLTDLRVLNLAGNVIEHVKNLVGLDSLVELNLRRNHIRAVAEVDNLPNLQRLFLSFNNITSLEDISCVGDSASITELALDGNPIDQESNYRQAVLRLIQHLRLFDLKRVTDDDRRIANALGRREDEKKRETSKIAAVTEKRRKVINTVRRHWEKAQHEKKDDYHHAKHAGNVPVMDLSRDVVVVGNEILSISSADHPDSIQASRPISAKGSHSEKEVSANARPNSVGPSIAASNNVDKHYNHTKESSSSSHEEYLSEIDGDTLQLYGTGSLDAFDRNWGIQAAGAVTVVSFHFADFAEIARVLPKIRIRFPNVSSLFFGSTNIRTLVQLNALATVRRLDNLVIESEGNPVTRLQFWRSYVIFRLSHLTLRRVNGVDVSVADIVSAEKFFGPLANIVTNKVPQFRLSSLLGDKKKQLLTDDKTKRNQNDTLKLFSSGTEKSETIGRAVLTYNSQVLTSAQDSLSRVLMVRNVCSCLIDEALLADSYRSALISEWPTILSEFVRKAVVDMSDRSAHMKRCLASESAWTSPTSADRGREWIVPTSREPVDVCSAMESS